MKQLSQIPPDQPNRSPGPRAPALTTSGFEVRLVPSVRNVVLSALIPLIKPAYSTDKASMIYWGVAMALSAAMLAGIPLGWILWRKYRAWLCEQDCQWRQAQAARLESVKERMKVAEIASARFCYPELPSVPLAGLLAPPCNRRFEPM
jgi:hypothetical protein